MCNKRKYNSEADAVKAAGKQVKKYGIHMRAYFHYDCMSWHLTGMGAKQFLKRFKR
jgi:hypothetical protein